jgi:hypothetical protein
MSTTFTVHLAGGEGSNEGIVVAFNPSTGIEGPVCGEDWDLKDVSIN